MKIVTDVNCQIGDVTEILEGLKMDIYIKTRNEMN